MVHLENRMRIDNIKSADYLVDGDIVTQYAQVDIAGYRRQCSNKNDYGEYAHIDVEGVIKGTVMIVDTHKDNVLYSGEIDGTYFNSHFEVRCQGYGSSGNIKTIVLNNARINFA